MAKNIIFCADGTWNKSDQDDDDDGAPDPTNVYKIFLRTRGTFVPSSLLDAGEQEKVLVEGGTTLQVAKYIHGVGDSRNPITRILGGAFGAGIIGRIVRGYTYISRMYEPGDRIVAVGFSRGAYTARALAGLIASQGLLAQDLTQDRELAYRYGAQAWYKYRKSAPKDSVTIRVQLEEIAGDLPGFLTKKSIRPTDLIPVEKILAVGVWDTVGAMGIPESDRHGKRMDAFKFADTSLGTKIEYGFHAVSRDELRESFTPTLWDKRVNVRQVQFPGAHADVGGGYPSVNTESDLSDIALEWMVDQLSSVGVLFDDVEKAEIKPNLAGTAHEPWLGGVFKILQKGSRTFPPDVPEHDSVAGRQLAGAVKPDPTEPPQPYR